MNEVYTQTLLLVVPLILLVMFVRHHSVTEPSPLDLRWIWLLPLIYTGLTVWILLEMPPEQSAWPWLGVGLAVGCVLGWLRGRSMTIDIDPQTGALSQSGVPMAMFVLMALVVVRFAMRFPPVALTSRIHIDAYVVLDVFMTFVTGLITLQRVEMWIRGRRLRAAPIASPAP